MQIKLVTTAPISEILMMSGARDRFNEGKFVVIRIRPYPPSFNRIPASTMDPATGASTWALGSHKWVINMGVFTKKAAMVINHQKDVNGELGIKFQ